MTDVSMHMVRDKTTHNSVRITVFGGEDVSTAEGEEQLITGELHCDKVCSLCPWPCVANDGNDARHARTGRNVAFDGDKNIAIRLSP